MVNIDMSRFNVSRDAVSQIANGGSPASNLLPHEVAARQAAQDNQQQQISSNPTFETRQMNDAERLFANLGRLGQNLAGSSGFSEYAANNGGMASLLTPEGAVRFGLSIPTGMMSALPSGAANLYAAATGSDVMYGSNVDDNTIRSEQLDTGQKIASGITGVIDTFGLAAGGSGSILSEGARAVRAGRGLEAARNTGFGGKLFGLSGTNMANRGAMGAVQGFAFDVAEEAGEEAVQTVMEDIIQKQLDEGTIGRAFESAAYGGLGGAVMSGGAMALRSATNSDIEKANNAMKAKESSKYDPYSSFIELQSSAHAGGGNLWTSSLADEVLSRRTVDRWTQAHPGSISGIIKNTGNIRSINEIGVGIEETQTIVRRGGDDELRLLKFLNNNQMVDTGNGVLDGTIITREQLREAVENADQNAGASILNAALDSAYGADGYRTITVVRNPATTNGGMFMSVKYFTTGRGFDMSGNTAQLLGGDFDGDRVALFFEERPNGYSAEAWASELIMSSEQGAGGQKSMLEHAFGSAALRKGSSSLDTIRNDLTEAISGIGLFTAEEVKAHVDSLMNAYSDESKDRNTILSAAINSFGESVYDKAPGEQQTKRLSETRSVDKVFEAFGKSQYTITELAEEEAQKTIDRILDSYENMRNKPWTPSAGDLGRLGTAASGNVIGIKQRFSESDFEQFYRNYATQVYNYVKTKAIDLVNAGENEGAFKSVAQQVILASCHVYQAGTEPVKTITGLIDAFVRAEYEAEYGSSFRASSSSKEREEQIKKFIESYNNWVEEFNKCRKVIIGNDEKEQWNMPTRKKFTYDTVMANNDEGKAERKRLGREFMRLFGACDISMFVPKNILPGTAYDGLSLHESIKLMVLTNVDPLRFSLLGESDKTSRFVEMLIDSFKDEGSRTVQAARNVYLSAKDLAWLVKELEDGTIDSKHIPALHAITEMLFTVLNPDAAVAAGVLDPKNWSLTKLGRELLSGDFDTFLAAATAINFGGKFMRFALKLNEDPKHKWTSEELDELTALGSIDSIHKEIADKFKDNEVSAIFQMLVDDSVTFESKQEHVNRFFQKVDPTVVDSLYMSSLMSTGSMASSDIESSLVTKINKGKTYAAQFNLMLAKNAEAELADVKTWAVENETHQGVSLWKAVQGLSTRANFKVSMRPLSVLFADIANVTNKQQEKGTATHAASALYIMLDMQRNGAQSSFDNDQFSKPFGNMMAVDLVRNPDLLVKLITDETFSIWVYDENGNSCQFNRDSLLMRCSETYRSMGDSRTVDNDMVWIELFEKCPNILSYLGGIGCSFAPSGDNVVTSVGKTGNFIDYLNRFANDEIYPTNDSELREFHRAAEKLVLDMMGDVRFYEYLFAMLPQETKDLAMSGLKEPPASLLWGKAIDLANGILAYQYFIQTGDRETYSSKFWATTRKQAFDQFTASADHLYSFMTSRLSGSIDNASNQLKRAFEDSLLALQLTALTNISGPIEYEVSGEKKTVTLNERPDLVSKANDLRDGFVSEMTDVYKDLYGAMLIVQNAIGVEGAQGDRRTMLGAVKQAFPTYSEEEQNAIADAINNKTEAFRADVMRQAAETLGKDLAEYGFNLSDILLSSSNFMFQSCASKEQFEIKKRQFKQIIANLGKFSHDGTRYGKWLADENYHLAEADDLFDLYTALFDDDGIRIEPVLPGTPDLAFEKLAMKFASKAIAPMFVRNSSVPGRSNPFVLDDVFEYVNFLDDMISDQHALDAYNSLGQMPGGYSNEEELRGFIDKMQVVPQVSSQEEMAFAHQLSEAVLAGRVTSEVGLNGSEVLNTAAFSFVQEDRPITDVFEGEPISAADLVEAVNAYRAGMTDSGTRTVSPEAYVVFNGKLSVIDDVFDDIKKLGEGSDLRIFQSWQNPHGVYLGTRNAPGSSRYGVKYKTVLGALNRIHMLAMENLVLKTKKQPRTNTNLTRERDRVRASRSGVFDSEEFLVADAMKNYELFVKEAARNILKTSEFKEDLQKERIGFDEILGIVQLMIPGYSITVKDANGNQSTLTVDINHVFDGTFAEEVRRKIPEGGIFVSAELLVVPLRVVSNRVAKAVFDADPTDAEAQKEAAFLAMTNWDDYTSGTLDIQEIVQQFSPLGKVHNSVVAERTPTALQNLVNDLYGEYGNRARALRHSPYTRINLVYPNPKDKTYEAIDAHTRGLVGGDDIDFVITNVFGLGTGGLEDKMGSGTIGHIESLRSINGRDKSSAIRVDKKNDFVLLLDHDMNNAEVKNAFYYAHITSAKIVVPRSVMEKMKSDPYLSFYPVNDGPRSLQFDPNNPNNPNAPVEQLYEIGMPHNYGTPDVLFDTRQAASSTIDCGRRIMAVMVDEENRYANGDGSSSVSVDFLKNFGIVEDMKTDDYDLNSIMAAGRDTVYKYENPTQDDIANLCALKADSEEGWDGFETAFAALTKQGSSHYTGYGEEFLKQAVVDYVNSIGDRTVNTIPLNGDCRGMCIGIVKCTVNGASDGVKYLPIIVSNRSGNSSVATFSFDDRAEAHVHYTRKISFDNPDVDFALKLAIFGKFANKSVATAVRGGLPRGFDGVENAATISSRMNGRDDVILYTNISNFLNKYYLNALFDVERLSNGDYKVNGFSEDFQKFVAGKGNPSEYLTRSINGRIDGESLWSDLLNAEGGDPVWNLIVPENAPVVNRQTTITNIKHAIENSKRFNYNPMALLGVSTFDFKMGEDGKTPILEKISREQTVPELDLAFLDWPYEDICDFYAAIGSRFQLMGSTKMDDADGYIFHRDGRMLVNDGATKYSKVLFDEISYMGHETESETPGNAAALGNQQRINKLMMYGYDSSDAEYVHALSAYLSKDSRAYTDELSDEAKNHESLLGMKSVISENLLESYNASMLLADLNGRLNDAVDWRRTIVDGNGKEIKNIYDDREISSAIENLRTALGTHVKIPVAILHRIVNAVDGSTKGDFELTEIHNTTFAKHLNTAAENYKNYGVLVIAEKRGQRYSIPTFDPSFVKYICDIADGNSDDNYDKYVKLMWEEDLKAANLYAGINEKKEAQQVELQKSLAAMRLPWNDENHKWWDGTFSFGGLTVQEMAKNDGILGKVFGLMGLDADAFGPLAKLGKSLIRNQQKRLSNEKNIEIMKSEVGINDVLAKKPLDVQGYVTGKLDNLVSYTRVASVFANPGVIIGNAATRGVSQTAMAALMHLGATAHIGPFVTDHPVSKTTIDLALSDSHLLNAFLAVREAGVTGEDLMFGSFETTGQLVEALSKMRSERTGFERFATSVFTFANGGNFGMKQQMTLFFQRLIMFMEQEPQLAPYLETNPQTHQMYIEDKIQEDAAGFFLSCFTAKGRPELYVCAQQALNSAMSGDMAQRQWLASYLHHLLSQHPIGRTMFAATICKFPRYQFNLMSKALNWFAPMSTFDYLMAHAAKKLDERLAAKAAEEGREYTPFNFELDQRFVNAREAMMYDAAHMGPGVVAMLLLGIGNAIQPPDDEDKWGDPDEWLICGYRVGESWWLSDLLGAFLPTVLYNQSCVLGKPTMSLLVNGSLSACYGNPFLRVADVTDTLISWNDDENFASYLSAVENYQNAEGGAPGLLDWLGVNAVGATANLITSTLTPSIVKEIYRNTQEYEKSYKRIYQKTPTGKLSEEGEKGKTQYTTYADAQIRRLCRNNPLLAILMDIMHPGTGTGYLASEMPDTLYQDEFQRAAADYYSIKDLDEQTAEERLLEIFTIIDGNDMDFLQEHGFYLDSETLYALGSYIWDWSYSFDDEWNKLKEAGALNYKVLGNGSYDDGEMIYAQMYNNKKAQQDHLRNVYNEKIKNSYLSKGIQQYRRYKTSYRTDANGEVYATGFHPQGALPFLTAPGTTTNPEGTAGYENDFMSVSAVTGQPMSQRALVPVPSERIDLPEFTGYSAKGNGDGFSGKWTRYLTNTSEKGKEDSGLTYPDGTPVPDAATMNALKNGSGYNTRGGSGGSGSGGGYSRRSSGGGSSYVPGISSRSNTPNTPNAAVSRSSRQYDANFDYLRPNVETKGSRDAYKRGDM